MEQKKKDKIQSKRDKERKKNYLNCYGVIYLDSFRETFKIKNEKVIDNINVITHIFKIQAYNSIICACFCIGYSDFIFKATSLINFSILFQLQDLKKKKCDEIIFNHFYEVEFKQEWCDYSLNKSSSTIQTQEREDERNTQ